MDEVGGSCIRASGSDLVASEARDTMHWSTGKSGQFCRGTVMLSLRTHFRLPCVALLATVGMFTVMGEARACSMEASAGGAHACCAGLPAPECGCASPAHDIARPALVGRSAARTTDTRAGLILPTRPCEC